MNYFNCNTDTCNCKLHSKYHIYGMCSRTTPCTHTLHYFDNHVKDQSINGDDLVRYCNNNNLPVPHHFEQYIDYVRQMDNPTPEERVENNLRQQLVKQKSDQRIQSQQKLTDLFNTIKSVLPSRNQKT